MNIDINTILIVTAVLANLISFVAVFSKLENRLTKLEVKIDFYGDNFKKGNCAVKDREC